MTKLDFSFRRPQSVSRNMADASNRSALSGLGVETSLPSHKNPVHITGGGKLLWYIQKSVNASSVFLNTTVVCDVFDNYFEWNKFFTYFSDYKGMAYENLRNKREISIQL